MVGGDDVVLFGDFDEYFGDGKWCLCVIRIVSTVGTADNKPRFVFFCFLNVCILVLYTV